MKVRITRSGGFAGTAGEELGAVDTDALHGEDAARIREAADDLVRREGESGDVGTDLYEYRVDLETEGGTHTLNITDRGEPEDPVDPALAELLRAVRRLS
jgi:hypothetical protein